MAATMIMIGLASSVEEAAAGDLGCKHGPGQQAADGEPAARSCGRQHERAVRRLLLQGKDQPADGRGVVVGGDARAGRGRGPALGGPPARVACHRPSLRRRNLRLPLLRQPCGARPVFPTTGGGSGEAAAAFPAVPGRGTVLNLGREPAGFSVSGSPVADFDSGWCRSSGTRFRQGGLALRPALAIARLRQARSRVALDIAVVSHSPSNFRRREGPNPCTDT